MTTLLPYSLPIGKSALTIPCPYGISDGHDRYGYSVLGIPINLGMSGTLLSLHYPESCLLLSW